MVRVFPSSHDFNVFGICLSFSHDFSVVRVFPSSHDFSMFGICLSSSHDFSVVRVFPSSYNLSVFGICLSTSHDFSVVRVFPSSHDFSVFGICLSSSHDFSVVRVFPSSHDFSVFGICLSSSHDFSVVRVRFFLTRFQRVWNLPFLFSRFQRACLESAFPLLTISAWLECFLPHTISACLESVFPVLMISAWLESIPSSHDFSVFGICLSSSHDFSVVRVFPSSHDFSVSGICFSSSNDFSVLESVPSSHDFSVFGICLSSSHDFSVVRVFLFLTRFQRVWNLSQVASCVHLGGLFFRPLLTISGWLDCPFPHTISACLEFISSCVVCAPGRLFSDLFSRFQRVRDAAYGTEDVIDKFKLHLAHHHGNGFRGFLRKIPRFIKTLKAHHQIASEVLRIKSRVINISQGHQRYQDRYGIPEASRSTSVNNSWYDCRGDVLLLEETKLAESSFCGGNAGLGKTTLVKTVYDDETVKKHFNNHAWLTVSESINIEDLMKDMIQQLFTEILQPVPSEVETMSINRLKGMEVCVVSDDVWDAIKSVLPDNNCGSHVILTTRLSDIASSTYCNETDGNVYNLMPLSAEESWMLFCNKTFRGNLCPPHFKKIFHKFFKKFNGLLLAIVAISGALAIKDQSRIDEWEMIYRNLGAELQGNDRLESMQKALSLSYNYLPDYLKTCFLYLRIFPEGQQIMCSKVIRLWIAEGFVNATESMTTEEVANNHLNELFNRSLLQVAQRFAYGRPRSSTFLG
ncbi:hypothetical protein ACSBR1_038012 [Camellia fascicularis]